MAPVDKRIVKLARLAAAATLLAFAASPGAARAASWTAYVANQGLDTVTPIDLATGTVGTDIAVAGAPTEVALAPDGATAFVTAQSSGDVTPIDVQARQAAPAVASGLGPTGIGVTPDGRTVYSTNQLEATTTPIDAAARVAGPALLAGLAPTSVAITPDGRTAFVANHSGATVTPIDLASGMPGFPILVGLAPTFVAVTPDGRTAYVTNELDSSVTPIDVVTRTAGAPIPVGRRPQGLAVTPDGRTAYVTNQADDTVTPVDLATGTPQAAIPVDGGPGGVAVTPDGRTAYVTNEFSSTVTPIDVVTGAPRPSVAVGAAPVGIAITPDPAPTASLSKVPAPAGTPSAFDGSRSSSPVGAIARYDWDFGDGVRASTTAASTSHVYAVAGSYTARLTVTNTAGTSLTQVFTGQTVSREGAPRARTQATVTVPARPASAPAPVPAPDPGPPVNAAPPAPDPPAPAAPAPPAADPAPPTAAPDPAPQADAGSGSTDPVTCTTAIVLTDVHDGGTRIGVGGIARTHYAGQTVVIAIGGRPVARTTVRADGTFQASFARPRRTARRPAYTAAVGAERSAALGLRPLSIVGQARSGAGVRIRGRLTGAGSAGRPIGVARQLGCPSSNSRVSAHARTSRSGTFALTLPRPDAQHAVAVYRISVAGAGSKSALILVRHDD